MVHKFLVAAILTVLCSTLAIAQCSCGDCDGESSSSFPVGSNYLSMDNVYGNMPIGGCGECGSDKCDGDCYGTNGTRSCNALSQCPYISVFGGGSWIDSFKQANIGQNTIDANRGGFDDGYIFGMAIGSQVHPNVRYELETSFRNHNAEEWFVEDFAGGIVIASAQNPATGELDSVAGMVNILFDFSKRQPGCTNFYGGVGVGIIFVDGEIVSAGTTYDVSDSSGAFQAIAGVSRAINQRVDIFGEYRFLNAQNVLVTDQTTPVSLGDFEYTNNSFLFGLRFRR